MSGIDHVYKKIVYRLLDNPINPLNCVCGRSGISFRDYTLFSSTHGTFIKIDHVLGYNTYLKYQATKYKDTTFSDHNTIKLERT